jgi:Uma2 family endonuclease
VPCKPFAPDEDRIPEPTPIAEVLSRSTADHDRGAKFRMYRTIPSVRYYLPVAQGRREVDVYGRAASGWELGTAEGCGAIELAELGCAISLDAIYGDSGR